MADEDVRWRQLFAFEAGLVRDGDIWAQMHRARNESTHVYNQEKAQALEAEIREGFAKPLSRLAADLEARL
ncbi:MAG: nucleotidyltransferase substrate binding protein [Spirochaetaceae bacterium]